jgi:hypothetical protein
MHIGRDAAVFDRRITGRVIDANGKPATAVWLQTVPVRPRDSRDMFINVDGTGVTGEEGRYTLGNLTPGDYYLGVSLISAPEIGNPYRRWFYPGTDDPAHAEIIHVSDEVGSQTFNFSLPPPQHERVIEGDVFWPEGQPAEHIQIVLRDTNYSYGRYSAAASTDANGHFKVYGVDGAKYRLHAATYANGGVSADPTAIAPGTTPLQLRLVLSRKGFSPDEERPEALERWRSGLGLK